MIISEAIKGYPGLSDLTDHMVERVCIDRDILPGDTYTKALKTIVNLTTADALMAKANDPDYSENDLSVSIKREQLIESANRLYRDNGEGHKTTQPTIRSRSNLW